MNAFIAVEYQLFIKKMDDDKERLQEKRTDEQPFVFITELNTVLPPFESKIAKMKKGDKIDFYIMPEEAYGIYNKDLVLDIPIENFLDDSGELNSDLFFVGNIIGLNNQEGQSFNAVILEIKDNAITVDLNHPRAGITMHFVGKVLEHRKATQQEIQNALEASKSCGGCSGCHGNCQNGCDGCGA